MTNGEIVRLAGELSVLLAWMQHGEMSKMPRGLLDSWFGLVGTTRNWRTGTLDGKPVERVPTSDGLALVHRLENDDSITADEANLLRALLLLRLGQPPLDCCGECGERGADHRRFGECPYMVGGERVAISE